MPLMGTLAGYLSSTGYVIIDVIGAISAFSFFLAGILYILARVFTLALAFTSLRDLPLGAFNTVHWTTSIPHI